MVATRWLRASAPLLILFARALAVDSDFSFYPDKAQPCLDDASSKSSCNGSPSTKALNECLCGNDGDFIINTAKCLGEKDEGDVEGVYSTMSQACADSDTPMSVSQSEFYAAADGKAKSTSTKTNSEPSSTGKPSDKPENNDDDGGGLSSGATIAIGVASGVVGIAAIGCLIFCLLRRKRRRGEESHPMLPQHMSMHNSMYGSPTTFPPTEPSPAFENESKPAWAANSVAPLRSPAHTVSPNPSSVAGWNSPPPQQQPQQQQQLHQSWMSNNSQAQAQSQQPQYAGPYAPPETVAELPPDTAAPAQGSHVFEMDGQAVSGGGGGGGHMGAVEMQGSAPPGQYGHG